MVLKRWNFLCCLYVQRQCKGGKFIKLRKFHTRVLTLGNLFLVPPLLLSCLLPFSYTVLVCRTCFILFLAKEVQVSTLLVTKIGILLFILTVGKFTTESSFACHLHMKTENKVKITLFFNY